VQGKGVLINNCVQVVEFLTALTSKSIISFTTSNRNFFTYISAQFSKRDKICIKHTQLSIDRAAHGNKNFL
jgi:hypothetical protein